MKVLAVIGRAALICSLALAGSTTQAQTKTLESGVTKVTLNSGFVSALGSLGLRAGVVGPTRLKGTVVNFPVTGGAVDLNTAKAQILHSGGLTLSPASATENAEPTVCLESFIIDRTGTQTVLTGIVVVNGPLLGGVPLFNLQLPAGLTLPLKTQDDEVVFSGVAVTLTSTAAQALNSVFNVTALHGGFTVGTVKVRASALDEGERRGEQ